MPDIPKLIVLSEQLRGQVFELTRTEHTIGRTEDRDVPIPDVTISGLHCTLVLMDDGSYVAQDEGSTNGTRLNGTKIKGGDSHPLANGDILQVGSIEMLYDCDSSRLDGSATQTVVDLQNTDSGELPVGGMKNLRGEIRADSGRFERGVNSRGIYVMWGVLGLLGLAVIVLLAILLSKMFAS
ncbi:MAG: FHA domain-containing protein [Lentisphaeria bacterium]|nr:FHA domain-containing protein [Lentisphaeria bacterium]